MTEWQSSSVIAWFKEANRMTAKTQTGKQMEKTGKSLNEALQDIKKLVWPNLSIEDVIRFMKFSPAWRP